MQGGLLRERDPLPGRLLPGRILDIRSRGQVRLVPPHLPARHAPTARQVPPGPGTPHLPALLHHLQGVCVNL